MPVTYINRKGLKYYLCQGVTKTGKPRFYFSREQKGEPLEEIPEDYKITESVNGIVSLSKIRPKVLSKQEINAVKKALKHHPQAKKYRLDVKSKVMTIYEQDELDLEEIATLLAAELGFQGFITDETNHRRIEKRKINTRYTPVMKFILTNKKTRLFRAERMCFLGNIDDWIDIEFDKTIEALANQLIPTLGTDEFYELY